jgi:DnaJ-class molecular chaperone
MSEVITHICPECNGRGELSGFVRTSEGGFYDAAPCQNCSGSGWLDEHGEPIQLDKEKSDVE